MPPPVNSATRRKDTLTNCAACTAAGAISLTVGHSASSSGRVAAARKQADGMYAMGDTREAQVINIADHVSRETGRKAEQSGADLSLEAATQWMNAQPEKSVFAVLATGDLVRQTGWSSCHWLNALKAGGKLRYFDFQSMRAVPRDQALGTSMRGMLDMLKSGQTPSEPKLVGNANPATSGRPFIAVETQESKGVAQRHLHAPEQTGSFTDDVKLLVIAFPPVE